MSSDDSWHGPPEEDVMPPPSEEWQREHGWKNGKPPSGANGKDHDSQTFAFTLFRDIQPAIDASDFVEGLLTTSSFVVVYGEPGSGKSFWVLDLCLHVAADRSWNDRAVDHGVVVYAALEGGAGICNRVAAARDRLRLPNDTAFVLLQLPIDLCHDDTDAAKFIATIQLVTAMLRLTLRLVVIDTLARAMAGSNENSPEDMGAVIANGDRIRHETGACVIYIHHSGKDAARGSRGHSSLKPATDTEIEVTRLPDRISVARVLRQRDLDDGASFAFRLEPVELGTNHRGKPVTSCVVVPAELPAAETANGKQVPALSPRLQSFHVALTQALVMHQVGARPTVTRGDWLEECIRIGLIDPPLPNETGRQKNTREARFRKASHELVERGVVAMDGDHVTDLAGAAG